ncbi:MAG: S41 family peptidase [Muribaculaceae bacterium]|nr:S41 family peptidase [Muribaculaceae bacterium]
MKKSTYLAGAIVAVSIAMSAATRSDKAELSRNLDIFSSVVKNLQTEYVDTIDANKTIRTAIDMMLMELDPYTEYIPEDEQEAFRSISTGEYGGIGSYIMRRKDNNVYISDPYDNSPARKAGLRAGDLIIAIDGDTVLGWTTDKVSNRLRGQSGTTVNLLIKRPYVEDSIKTISVEREKIAIHPVPYYGVIHDSIGYIDVTTFSDKTYPEVKAALLDLKSNPKVNTIMLDLRSNGGGVLDGAVDLVSLFVPKGTEVLRTRGKGQVNERVYKTTNKPVDVDIPLVVLVNSGSASASEIVAGSLQDLDRAVIVGRRSFGKGLVQSSRPLPYNGLLKVTIAKYYIPSGRLIQAIDYSHRNEDGSVGRIPDSLTHEFKTNAGRIVRDGGGIKPDVEVELPDGSRLLYNIMADNWAFDYANKYSATHDSIAPATDFEVTDEMFEDFKAFIDPEQFNYDKVCDTMLDDLEKVAKTEGYLNDETKAQIEVLRGLMKHNLGDDLDNNRKEVSEVLAAEIISRYYGDRGEVIQSLKHDYDVEAALKMLNTPGEYKRLLSPQK